MASTITSILKAGLTCLVLAGCGGRPQGVLTPVTSDIAGTHKVHMLIATTREPDSADPGVLFTGERGKDLSFASMVVSIPPESNRSKGEVQWPSNRPGNAATDFVTTEVTALKAESAVSAINKTLAAKAKGRVLVFVHGYNNRFEEAVYRLAQIAHDSQTDAVPVLFTWPSRGRLFSYYYDRESANYSRDGLEQVLRDLSRNPNVKDISILAHSMGNWVTMESLRQIAIADGRILPKVQNVMLAAPDVDVNVFLTQMSRIGFPRPRFTLFVSRDDRALALSQRIADGEPRLGAADPTAEPLKSNLEKERVVVLDLTEVSTVGTTNHDKFASSPQVVRFIGNRLIDGQTIETGSASLGDRIGLVTTGVTGVVGRTAGAILAAPVAVFDSNTRDTFADHFNELGKEASDALGAPLRNASTARQRRGGVPDTATHGSN
jgi:esterase/lipase superfamily enzyme